MNVKKKRPNTDKDPQMGLWKTPVPGQKVTQFSGGSLLA